MADVFFTGGPAAAAYLDALVARELAATREAVSVGAHLVEQGAKSRASGRPGPNIISDRLRGGIHVEGPHPIPAGFEAEVLTSAPYGGLVDRGTSHAPAYPYLSAEMEYAERVELPAVFETAWSRGLM